jgi:hypothetical protein
LGFGLFISSFWVISSSLTKLEMPLGGALLIHFFNQLSHSIRVAIGVGISGFSLKKLKVPGASRVTFLYNFDTASLKKFTKVLSASDKNKTTLLTCSALCLSFHNI